MPSLREGFGLAALEALASGVPVIASDLPALAGIVRDGVDGLLMPPGNSDAFRVTLAQFVSDGILRESLSRNAGTNLDRWDIQSHVGRILSISGLSS